MDQKKTGYFLKQLRNEKKLTQEQLAEKFQITSRTVSRWETGSNMPDISMLLELADFYEVDIREIIDGERKSEQMNEELKETVIKVTDYTETNNARLLKTGTDHRNYRCDHNTDCNGHGRRWTGSVSVLGKCEAGSVCVDAWHAYCKHTVYNGMAQTDK